MEKEESEIYFFGYGFRKIRFLLLCVCWTLFICFIWPLIIGSYFFVTVIVCGLSLVFAGIVNSRLLIGLFVLLLISRKIVVFYQNFMLVLSAFLGTLAFSWFVKMSTFVFLDQLVINMITVFMYYKLLIAAGTQD